MRLPSSGLAVVLALALASAAPSQVLQLKSGEVLVGKVEDPREDGLTFRRLDTGGILDLRWDQLSSECAGRLKTMAGLSVDEDSEILVTADAVKYEVGGGGMEEIVGRIVAESATTITVRRKGLDTPVPRANVKRRGTREVPALDIYTLDEFYNDRLADAAPEEDADKHILLADELVRVRDFGHAALHLARAKELGGGRQPNVLEGKQKRLALFQSAAAEADLLDKIRAALARRQFAPGRKLLEDYDKRFPAGKLRSEVAATRQRLEKARERHLSEQAIEMWKSTMFALAQKKATDAAVTWEAAKEYAESQMGQDIRARIQKVLGITPDELDALWTKRHEAGRLRTESFSYGLGSWTLGADAVLKDTQQGKAEAAEAKPTEQDREAERQLKRIQEAIQRAQRQAAQSQAGPQAKEDTPQDWWKDAGHEARTVWLRAYYAEHSGDLKIVSAHLSACVTCGSDGSLTVFGQSGKPEKVPCSTCHGVRFVRWFRAH